MRPPFFEPRPPAPWLRGECFDAAALVFFGRPYWLPSGISNPRLCHGLGKFKGRTAVHAWIEADWNGRRIAFDCNWWVCADATWYRNDWEMTFVQEFTPAQACFLWALYDMPGPWHPKLLEVADRVVAERNARRDPVRA